MNSFKSIKLIAAILVLLVIAAVGCKSTLYMPASNNPDEQQKLLAGRDLYIQRCGSCHNLHFPQEFKADEWKKKIGEMQMRAKINDEQKELILNYLVSAK